LLIYHKQKGALLLGLKLVEARTKAKLTMPVLALGGGYIPVLGGNITMPSIIYGMKILAQNVTGITVPNSGHYIQEEQPHFLVDQLFKFFGNSTK
jgi:pimeloyl-ACP methyl ester carboxylesterase